VRAPKEHLRESRPPRPILAPCAETSPRSGGWIQKRPLRKLNLQLVSTFGRSAGCNPPRPPPSSPLKRPFAELPRPRPTCWPNCHRAVCLLRLFRPCDARQSPELDRSNPGEPPMAPPCRRSGAGSVADEFSLPPFVPRPLGQPGGSRRQGPPSARSCAWAGNPPGDHEAGQSETSPRRELMAAARGVPREVVGRRFRPVD